MNAKTRPSLPAMLALLALLAFASCARHSAVWPRLLEAEKLLETDYKAAGAMLDRIDSSSLQGPFHTFLQKNFLLPPYTAPI